MSTDQIKANYTAAGINIIEMMYTDDYLSIGGDQSTRSLADAAGINSDSRILDVGCGLGGPALFLAEQYGCHVTGLDLIDVNIAGAIERAKKRGLASNTAFHVGEATNLPYADASFNVVWGLDAWCHVHDKVALIDQCARVLEPGGTVAFTDWVVTGDMTAQHREAVLDAAASPAMTTAGHYLKLFDNAGLKLIEQTDLSPTFVQQYQEIMDRLPSIETRISEQYSPKVFEIIKQKNSAIADGFVSGGIGGARFVAKKTS